MVTGDRAVPRKHLTQGCPAPFHAAPPPAHPQLHLLLSLLPVLFLFLRGLLGTRGKEEPIFPPKTSLLQTYHPRSRARTTPVNPNPSLPTLPLASDPYPASVSPQLCLLCVQNRSMGHIVPWALTTGRTTVDHMHLSQLGLPKASELFLGMKPSKE